MHSQHLEQIFGISHRALSLNVDGVSDEEALAIPNCGASSINWVVGHILEARHTLAEYLGESPPWDPQLRSRYARGSRPEPDATRARPLSTMLAELAALQTRLLDRLREMSDKDLAASVPGEEGDLGRQLAFRAFHEAYHVGQLGVLRRQLGKPGAIA